jgi:hypothetical protein
VPDQDQSEQPYRAEYFRVPRPQRARRRPQAASA